MAYGGEPVCSAVLGGGGNGAPVFSAWPTCLEADTTPMNSSCRSRQWVCLRVEEGHFLCHLLVDGLTAVGRRRPPEEATILSRESGQAPDNLLALLRRFADVLER